MYDNNLIVIFCPFHQNIRSSFSLRKAILANSFENSHLTYVEYIYDLYVDYRNH